MKISARSCLLSVLGILSMGVVAGGCGSESGDDTGCVLGINECIEDATQCSLLGTTQICMRNEMQCLTWQDQPQNFLGCQPSPCDTT